MQQVIGKTQQNQLGTKFTLCGYLFRPVKIIRLIGKNTVEEIILKRAEEKLKLTKKVIETGDFASTSAKPTYAQNRTQVK